ncbi:MAG: hypothetical protein V4561_01555 [Bacteroidota bacterium]
MRQKVEHCEGKDCKIDLNTLTPFKWDTAFYFSGLPTLELIENTIGKPYGAYVEFSRVFIFKHKGKIVYSENYASGIEHLTKNQLVFNDILDSSSVKIIFSGKAIFNCSLEEEAGIDYIKLK